MLKIRLTRTGKTKQPQYRIIVSEQRAKRDGDFTALLGYYKPISNPARLKLDIKEYDTWITKGAQPTEVVKYLRSKTTSDQEISIQKTKKDKGFKAKRAVAS